MDKVLRISRVQEMDALLSMASIAGYCAVIEPQQLWPLLQCRRRQRVECAAARVDPSDRLN